MQDDLAFVKAVLGAVGSNAVVLDGFGKVVFISEDSHKFAIDVLNGANLDEGSDYLSVISDFELESPVMAKKIRSNLLSLMRGERQVCQWQFESDASSGERWYQGRACELHHQGARFVVVTHIDITESKLFERSLALGRDEAEAASKSKSTFLATMSHEIRTPLNGMVSTMDLLSLTRLDDYQQSLVKTAEDSAHTMQRVIDDVLDFSKIEAGHLDIESAPVNVESLVESVADSLSALALDKGVALRICCGSNMPVVLGDAVRIKQILFNLAGNGIKFSSSERSREGLVVVRADCIAQQSGQAVFRFVIEDNGIGISAEVQERLFQPFTQGQSDIARRFGGTGLGLVITRRLVDLMGGEVSLESRLGEGSAFTVTLGLPVSQAASVPPKTLGGLPLILLSDDSDSGSIVVRYLRDADADLRVVNHGAIIESLAGNCGDQLYVVMFEDDNCVSHVELRDALRCAAQESGITLVFLLLVPGRQQQPGWRNADELTLGMTALKRASLLEALLDASAAEHMEAELPAEEPAVLRETEVESNVSILLAEDNPVNQMVIGQQLKLLGYQVDIADDGEKALDQWLTNDYALLLTDCHMPNMDGYELSRRVRREQGEGDRKPIIAITADAMKGTAVRCFSAGMDDFISKPVKIDQLRTALQKWLKV